MGTAAYNRGSKAISNQIDRELSEKKRSLRSKVKHWMFYHADEYETATELAENATWEWGDDDASWLDDELHWVWDDALEAIENKEKRHGNPSE